MHELLQQGSLAIEILNSPQLGEFRQSEEESVVFFTVSVKVNHQAALRGVKPSGCSGSFGAPHLSEDGVYSFQMKACCWCTFEGGSWGYYIERIWDTPWSHHRGGLSALQGGRKGATFALKLREVEALVGGIYEHCFLLYVAKLTYSTVYAGGGSWSWSHGKRCSGQWIIYHYFNFTSFLTGYMWDLKKKVKVFLWHNLCF